MPKRPAVRGYPDIVTDPEALLPPPPEYSEDGVDVSLIRWFLSLTPLERLQFLEDRTNDILEIRELNGRS
jgi:hypothetical protein